MEYKYKIHEDVYDDISLKKKTVEFRLLNEKSKSIKTGDTIKFVIANNEEKYIMVNVINISIYKDIADLWNHKEIIKNNVLGYNKEELLDRFIQIFGKEQVYNSKIVGIEFKVMEEI